MFTVLYLLRVEKMKALIFYVLLLCLTVLYPSCRKTVEPVQPAFNTGEEKALVAEAIENSICWAMTKDTVKLYSHLVPDSSLYIINPDSSVTRGIEGIRYLAEHIWLDERFRATACNISDLNIGLSRGGDVAWFACMLDDIGEWDGRPSGWKNTRWTGVLEKRDGRWLILQMHFSFAVNE
jgi:hypothetical protein